jgi:hypothetical protein
MSNFKMRTPLGEVDLDDVFALRTNTDLAANPTGFLDPSNNDLCLRYKKYNTGTQAAATGFNVMNANGTITDLNQIFSLPKGMTWIAMGTGIQGFYGNSGVYAMSAINNSNVYIGGYFTSAGSVSNTRRIAKWNGTNWQAMGTGMDDAVFAISAVDNSNVYVGGYFTSAGGVAITSRIAKWNGTDWQSLSSGVNGAVLAISARDNSNVYVGGQFNNIGNDTKKSCVAKWNGTTWQAMGAGITGNPSIQGVYVYAISTFDNSNVYVGGQFLSASGVPNTNGLAKWNGSAWQSMWTGINGTVKTISVVDNSNVYVGGNFTNVGGDYNKRCIAKWNGTTWRTMGSGIPIVSAYTAVNTISAIDNSNIYIGGNFTNIGGDFNKNYIAKWDGTTWQSFGSYFPFNSSERDVIAMSAVNKSNVYIGGVFSESVSKSNIVKWTNDY